MKKKIVYRFSGFNDRDDAYTFAYVYGGILNERDQSVVLKCDSEKAERLAFYGDPYPLIYEEKQN